MCASCGCGQAEDKHGDERNISWSEIVQAGEATNTSPEEAIENMSVMAGQQQQSSGSTMPKAERQS